MVERERMFSWFRRLFVTGRRAPSRTPCASTQVLQLLITAADQIRLQDRTVSLADLQPALQRYAGKEVVVCYQREHPERPASPLAMEVVHTICRLGLPIAFPPEARPTIEALTRQIDPASGHG